MADDEKPETDGSERIEDQDSALDDILLGGDADPDAVGDGLELDGSQAQEIRQIFLISLPQYLEPIEQLIEQLFSEEAPGDETKRALLTTVSSIIEAAARIGVDDVRDVLERMYEHIALLDDEQDPSSARQEILGVLNEIKTLAEQSSGFKGEAPALKSSQTIVEALKNAPGIDASVLQKLTTAGVVTVDQLEQAEPREVVAVTGLELGIVQKIIDLCRASATRASEPAGRLEAWSPGGTQQADGSAHDAAASPPRSTLELKLRAQVEMEASLEELRVGVQRQHRRNLTLKNRLAAARRRRDELRTLFSRTDKRLAERLVALTRARAQRDRTDERKTTLEERLVREEQLRVSLTREREALLKARASVAEELAHLSESVTEVVGSASRKGEPERLALQLGKPAKGASH